MILDPSIYKILSDIRDRYQCDLIIVGGYPRSLFINEPFNDIDVWINDNNSSIFREKIFPFDFHTILKDKDLLYPVNSTDVVHNQIYIKLTDDDPYGKCLHYSEDTEQCIVDKILKFSNYGFEYLNRREFNIDRFRGLLKHLGKNLNRGYRWDKGSRENFMMNVERIIGILKNENPFYEEMLRKDLKSFDK